LQTQKSFRYSFVAKIRNDTYSSIDAEAFTFGLLKV